MGLGHQMENHDDIKKRQGHRLIETYKFLARIIVSLDVGYNEAHDSACWIHGWDMEIDFNSYSKFDEYTYGISITIFKKEVTFPYTLIVQNYLTINYITRQPL